MQGIRIFSGCKRVPFSRIARPVIMALFVWVCAASAFAAERIAVFPATPFDGYIVYESLAVFWIGIIGIIVVIRMKLREIERTQEMGEDREDNDAPLLE